MFTAFFSIYNLYINNFIDLRRKVGDAIIILQCSRNTCELSS